MDVAEFREAVESAKSTQLNRLGSNRFLIAATGADLEPEPVLRTAAHSEHAAVTTFEEWADDEDHPDAREVFAAVADQERDHYERVREAMDDPEFEPADGGPLHTYLRAREDAVERAGAGVVGRGLVSVRAHTQVVSFFVNEADERRADLFRDLKAETEEEIERGLDLLAGIPGSEDDRERARTTAEYAIQVAYDDYTDSLDELGLDPKPIC